jgi:hypothetical protein
MEAHKRIQITIETHQLLTIRRRAVARRWCRECGCEVEVVGAGELEALTGVPGLALRDSARTQRWHLLEAEDGSGVLCLQSLLKSL